MDLFFSEKKTISIKIGSSQNESKAKFLAKINFQIFEKKDRNFDRS